MEQLKKSTGAQLLTLPMSNDGDQQSQMLRTLPMRSGRGLKPDLMIHLSCHGHIPPFGEDRNAAAQAPLVCGGGEY